MIIDGYTQPGASSNTLAIGDNAVILIKILGDPTGDRVIQLCSPTACGLPGDSSGSTMKGLCLAGPNNTHETLIFVGSNNDVVAGNFTGVDTNGVTVVSDGTPVQVGNGGSFHATGTMIGGTSPAARNIIASNGGFALIDISGDNTLVQGNYMGVNAAETAILGMCATGISVEQGSGNTIGGTAAGAGNVINATGDGIQIGGICSNCLFDTTIQGNLIGTDATGTVAFYALLYGIVVDASVNPTIGGSAPGAGNVITARADGIIFSHNPTGVVIQGNKIGIDITGTMPLGNGNCGIDTGAAGPAWGPTSWTIGGVNAGEGNIIAFNGFNGVSITSVDGINRGPILGNSIHDNGLLGITLAASGCGTTMPTPNRHDPRPRSPARLLPHEARRDPERELPAGERAPVHVLPELRVQQQPHLPVRKRTGVPPLAHDRKAVNITDLVRQLLVPDGETYAFSQRVLVTWDRRDNAFNASRGHRTSSAASSTSTRSRPT